MLALTLAEYVALIASLPRGPFGPIWPAGLPHAVLIVPDEPTADVPPALVTAAAADAAARRN